MNLSGAARVSAIAVAIVFVFIDEPSSSMSYGAGPEVWLFIN